MSSFWIWEDSFDQIEIKFKVECLCITVEANSVAVSNIGNRKHVVCIGQ